MKLLKDNLKVIIAFVIGLILAGGIVYAATSAREVNYTTSKNTDIKNVEEALNDLYKNKKGVKSGSVEVPANSTSSVDTGLSNVRYATAVLDDGDRVFCYFDGVKYKCASYDYEIYAENGTIYIYSPASAGHTFYWYACE